MWPFSDGTYDEWWFLCAKPVCTACAPIAQQTLALCQFVFLTEMTTVYMCACHQCTMPNCCAGICTGRLTVQVVSIPIAIAIAIPLAIPLAIAVAVAVPLAIAIATRLMPPMYFRQQVRSLRYCSGVECIRWRQVCRRLRQCDVDCIWRGHSASVTAQVYKGLLRYIMLGARDFTRFIHDGYVIFRPQPEAK